MGDKSIRRNSFARLGQDADIEDIILRLRKLAKTMLNCLPLWC